MVELQLVGPEPGAVDALYQIGTVLDLTDIQLELGPADTARITAEVTITD